MRSAKDAQGSRLKAQGRTAVAFSLQPGALSKTADLLFEIGTEELPAAYLPDLIEQLGAETRALLEAHHLPFRTVQSFGTPRRLVLIARGLAGTQRKPGEEVRGPSKQVAYDGAGKPTKALVGFLRAQSGALGQVKIVASEKGEYVYLVKPPTAIPTATILPALLPQLVGKLRAPKTMRWDASGVRFARPIRWMFASYNSRHIRFCLAGATLFNPKSDQFFDEAKIGVEIRLGIWSGATTRIGRPQALREVRVASIPAYFQTIERAGLLLDQVERQRRIQQLVTREARRIGGIVAPEMLSHGLMEEVTFLTESPVALTGTFDSKYLALPREVLLASMAKYQRVFAIEARGKLLPRFVAILEGPPRKPAAVRQIIERILNARLADSLMFWTEDRRHLPLEQMAAALSGVTFHERIGSMADKAERVHTLSAVLEKAWQLSREEQKDLRRACQLAKADLVSTLVKEFPTLQGVIGKYYARHSREPQEVAEAIEEHYLPIGDRLPKTLIGSALAVLDKYDTLASYFAQGIVPTGDQDPFGLRRAAQGIVEVGWKVHRPLPLERFFGARSSTDPFRTAPQEERAATGERIRRYILERLYTFEWPKPAPSRDIIEAVLASPCDDLVDAMDRIVSLKRLDGDPRLLKAAKVIERTCNILKPAEPRKREVDPARFQEPLEQRLWALYSSKKEEIERLATGKSYAEATRLFGEVFYQPLHEFFDRVMVNVPDESLQQNRLALMQAINTLYTDRIADLSKLTVLQH
ncbi:MAG: glycine--tRNA ligase subunit beta [Candidatus Omnitrophica bacterium]|nr:glycine--tRNA ligase subunit beta [Candidatus Omnitrophota bacterium]